MASNAVVKKGVGKATKKEDREADGTGSGSSGEIFRENDLASNSVDDGRRLYVTK
ncbi:hypothetical protein [Guptibacillus sedimenti]|uniref:hypothetical protein n=1 Tax=Guptibacillus sedimenti TaxID=3025680 RepID=UPI00236027F7|nr:hypothetical protein [Pseudalkalibacillus sedimenti]